MVNDIIKTLGILIYWLVNAGRLQLWIKIISIGHCKFLGHCRITMVATGDQETITERSTGSVPVATMDI